MQCNAQVKVNENTFLLKKITSIEFYVMNKFKRQGCLREYKKET